MKTTTTLKWTIEQAVATAMVIMLNLMARPRPIPKHRRRYRVKMYKHRSQNDSNAANANMQLITVAECSVMPWFTQNHTNAEPVQINTQQRQISSDISSTRINRLTISIICWISMILHQFMVFLKINDSNNFQKLPISYWFTQSVDILVLCKFYTQNDIWRKRL